MKGRNACNKIRFALDTTAIYSYVCVYIIYIYPVSGLGNNFIRRIFKKNITDASGLSPKLTLHYGRRLIIYLNSSR